MNGFKVFGRSGVSVVDCSREKLPGEAINLKLHSLYTFAELEDLGEMRVDQLRLMEPFKFRSNARLSSAGSPSVLGCLLNASLSLPLSFL